MNPFLWMLLGSAATIAIACVGVVVTAITLAVKKERKARRLNGEVADLYVSGEDIRSF